MIISPRKKTQVDLPSNMAFALCLCEKIKWLIL